MVRTIVGANWGDEGKGKVTDLLAEESDVVVRFQGGANAGHTIINEYGKFALHLLRLRWAVFGKLRGCNLKFAGVIDETPRAFFKHALDFIGICIR